MAIKYFLLLLLFMPSGHSAQTKVLPQKQLNILTLGDSNGTFPHSWPKQLGLALPNARIFNISKSGRTIGFVNNGDSSLNSLLVIDENLKKAAEFTKDRPFDFIVLELGTNDGKAVFADRQNEVPVNLERLLQKIKGADYPAINQAKIIVIAPPPYGAKAEATEKYAGGGKRVENMSKSFAAIAKRNGCLFVNGFETPGLDINTMTADGLHLDSVASKKLIEPVVKIMMQESVKRKRVVLTFDDAPQSHYSFVAPVLQRYGFGATFYVCEFPGVYPDSTISLNWRQVGELGRMGFEIGNHTWHHKHVPGIKEQDLVRELAYVERKCDSLGLPKMTSFCYPAYTTDTLAVRVLQQRGYTNARTGNDRPYDPAKDDPFYIPAYTISKDSSALFYKALQDAKEGEVVVYCFHGVPDKPHPWVSTEQEAFKVYMQYLFDHNYEVIAMRDLP